MLKVVEIVYRVVLSLWTGAMIYMTFVATPAIFAHLPRDQAAAAVAVLFPPTITLGYAAGVLLFLSAFVLYRAESPRAWTGGLLAPGASGGFGRLPVLLTGLMLALSLYGGLLIFPKAESLRRHIPSFDTESPQRAEFRRLHGVSSGMNLVVLSCGALLLVLQAARDAARRQG